MLFEVLDEDNESFRIIHQAAHELKPTDQNVLFHQPKAIFNHYLESKVLHHLSKAPPHEIYQSVSIIYFMRGGGGFYNTYILNYLIK